MKMVITALYFWSVIQALNNWNTLILQSISWNNYVDENQEICFHHHHQACLIYYLIRTRCHYWCMWSNVGSRSDPGYFVNWVRPTWPWQNMSQMTWPDFNPARHTNGTKIDYHLIIIIMFDTNWQTGYRISLRPDPKKIKGLFKRPMQFGNTVFVLLRISKPRANLRIKWC